MISNNKVPNPSADVADPSETPPTVAGIYNYLVGGSAYTTVDSTAAEAMAAQDPDIKRSFRDNLQHNVLRVRDLVSQGGFRRILDIGAGTLIPGRDPYSVANEGTESVQVVCVDIDEEAVRSGKALYDGLDGADYIQGDLRNVSEILQTPAMMSLLAAGEPVAVLLCTVLHYLGSDDIPENILREIRDAVPEGSVVVLSQCVPLDHEQERQEVVDTGFAAARPLVLRTVAEIEALVAAWGTPEPPVYVGEWGVSDDLGSTAATWVATTSATKQPAEHAVC